MIQLSFSSLSLLHDRPHCWLNKVMGIPQPEKKEWAEGKHCHTVIQRHISGVEKDKRIDYLKVKFPVVEMVDFDERCRFEFSLAETILSFKVSLPWKQIKMKNDYAIIGFIDARDEEWTEFGEIKTSFQPWSIAKFKKSPQRKIYGLAKPSFKNSTLITGSRNPDDWVKKKLKVYKVPVTEQDRMDAIEYILGGIKILESGNFTSDLVNGKCIDPWCYWGENCQFK